MVRKQQTEKVMNEKQEQNRIDAILAMPENTVKTLWNHVVIRGVGLNWKLDSMHTRWMGPMDTAHGLK